MAMLSDRGGNVLEVLNPRERKLRQPGAGLLLRLLPAAGCCAGSKPGSGTESPFFNAGTHSEEISFGSIRSTAVPHRRPYILDVELISAVRAVEDVHHFSQLTENYDRQVRAIPDDSGFFAILKVMHGTVP